MSATGNPFSETRGAPAVHGGNTPANRRCTALLLLSLCGLLLNGLLLYWKLFDRSAGIAGCGGGGGCNEVLASRWSQVFGLPIPVLGILIYVLLAAALLWRKGAIVSIFSGAIVGSAVWFVIVQAVLLHHFCPWCMATHSVGILIAVLAWTAAPWRGHLRWGLPFGLAAAFGLVVLQVLGPVPASHRIDTESPFSPAGGIHELGAGRKIAFDDGRRIYDNSLLPGLGSVDATHVLVEYFDYKCPSCRTMSGYLAALIAKHPAKVQVLLLPVPLDHGCNPELALADDSHRGSCELTQIALAVWRAKPDAFPAIHRAFLSDASLDKTAALSLARGQVPAERLEAAMQEPWIDQLIQADIADWVSFSGKTRKLPKLLISGKRILHGLPSGEADFIRVMEKELGL